jgi:hypothetical protein
MLISRANTRYIALLVSLQVAVARDGGASQPDCNLMARELLRGVVLPLAELRQAFEWVSSRGGAAGDVCAL